MREKNISRTKTLSTLAFELLLIIAGLSFILHHEKTSPRPKAFQSLFAINEKIWTGFLPPESGKGSLDNSRRTDN